MLLGVAQPSCLLLEDVGELGLVPQRPARWEGAADREPEGCAAQAEASGERVGGGCHDLALVCVVLVADQPVCLGLATGLGVSGLSETLPLVVVVRVRQVLRGEGLPRLKPLGERLQGALGPAVGDRLSCEVGSVHVVLRVSNVSPPQAVKVSCGVHCCAPLGVPVQCRKQLPLRVLPDPPDDRGRGVVCLRLPGEVVFAKAQPKVPVGAQSHLLRPLQDRSLRLAPHLRGAPASEEGGVVRQPSYSEAFGVKVLCLRLHRLDEVELEVPRGADLVGEQLSSVASCTR